MTFVNGHLVALALTVAAAYSGYLGFAAFNPDDGFLLHSEMLWRTFGITAYAGFAGIYLFPAIALGRLLVLRALRAGRRRFRSV